MRPIAAVLIGRLVVGLIGVQIGRVIMLDLRLRRIAMGGVTRRVLMMSKRHALGGHHRGHALKRHDAGDHQHKNAKDP